MPLLRNAGVALLAVIAAVAQASGQPASPPSQSSLQRDEQSLYERESQARARYARIFGTLAFGRGLRFNNPFRLRTQLGDTAESLSLTAPYVDLGFAVGFGNPFGLQHGPNLHASFALSGVSQTALGISYMLLYRGSSPLMIYGRGGVSILTAPDANAGAELAAGLGAFFTGSLGATAELCGDLYYGAATYDKKLTSVPVLSLQLGMIVDFEVLP